jgi:hypothetical protein
MPLATSAATDALAYALASLRGLSPDQAVASALRAELDREKSATRQAASGSPEPTVEDILTRINSLGPWQGPTGDQLTHDLYDNQGLPR